MPPQRERIPSSWTAEPAQEENTPAVNLTSNDPGLPFRFTLEAVRPNVFRTTFTSDTHPLPPHPSVPVPKTDLSEAEVTTAFPTLSTKQIAIGDIRVELDWSASPTLSVSLRDEVLREDVPHRSYAADGPGISHYTRYDRTALYVGLGEKAAPMNLSGRRFEISATDAFGYDAHRTDPLYKHLPLLICAGPAGCIASFSTSHSRGSYSVGSEMDGMWGRYNVYRQDYGGLEEYLLVGRTLADVVRAYADIAGYPLLVPRWAFGYISGGMKYSMLDDPPAHEALLEVARKLREHDIPCSAHQMSSGYTVSETPPHTRNVFTWNHHRFPDPRAFTQEYHRLGIRLIANVKPYVLANHPEYEKLRAAGALFKDPRTGDSAVTRLWSAGGGESGEGGHIDFTSAAGFKWWYDGVRRLCEDGIDCMWNDNNEYTVPDDDWICALDNPSLKAPDSARERPDIGFWGRAVNTELHGKASHDAMVDAHPNRRPFVLTRGATAGTMRYAASSWSGDNVTSWDGMRGGNALSLNAGMSLMHCYGHDIGGFEGPQPSPELLVRWVQLGIHSPRFAINCFKTGDDNKVGDVIEPWMYPSVTPLVRKAIKRRYAMIPYFYSLMHDGRRTAAPPQRWTGWGYEADMEVWTKPITDGETQYWLGDALLVGGVYEPGVSKARVYLPRASDADLGFLNLNAPYQHLTAGQWVTIDAEWHGSGIPVLGKVGTAIPIGRDVQVLSPGEEENVADLPLDDFRAVEIFPPPAESSSGLQNKWFVNIWYEDDGVSTVDKTKVSEYTVSYAVTEDEVRIRFNRDESSGFVAPWKSIVVVLPAGDVRSVSAEGHQVTAVESDELGRKRFELS